MLVEGQGEFRQPPADNYNLPLDPYQAASSFVMLCSYVDGMTSFDYTWTKDGANQPSIQSVGNGVQTTVPVPNGEYLSSLEGAYTCRVSLGGNTRGSRKITVTLPGEPRPVCTSPTSHTQAQSCKGSVMYHDHLLYTTFRECYCHVVFCILNICWLYRIFRNLLFYIMHSYCS